MGIKKKLQPSAEIDVTAFADIAFLLIIFFILTTSFLKLTGQPAEIPAGQRPEEPQEEDRAPTVTVTPRELRYGEGEEAPVVTMAVLRRRLYEADFPGRADPQEQVVIVECKDDVPWERYFRVVTAVSRAGGKVAILEDVEAGEEGEEES
jgi:biopolymer transport protein ExbD